MISQYLFEYQRFVNMHPQHGLSDRLRLVLMSGGVALTGIAAWLAHCALNDCPMFG